MSSAGSEASVLDGPVAEGLVDVTEAALQKALIGEFRPLEAYVVSFTIQALPPMIFPPEWTVHGTVRSVIAPVPLTALFVLNQTHPVQTVTVTNLPGGYHGTMTFTLAGGMQPSLTLEYALEQHLPHPAPKNGTYVFRWAV